MKINGIYIHDTYVEKLTEMLIDLEGSYEMQRYFDYATYAEIIEVFKQATGRSES